MFHFASKGGYYLSASGMLNAYQITVNQILSKKGPRAKLFTLSGLIMNVALNYNAVWNRGYIPS